MEPRSFSIPTAKTSSRREATTAPPASRGSRLTEFFVRHRWAFVVPIVLPLSKLYELGWRIRNVHLRDRGIAGRRHEKKVAGVQAQVSRWNAEGRPAPLVSSRKGWQTVSPRMSEYKKTSYPVDVELHDILEIDLERRVLRVEPRANMAQITRALIPKGFTLPVVPELDDLTVGGLIMGYGIEASSHKYGLFADTVRAMEVVLADGRRIRASADEHRDLFHALPWSYGALGFVTAVELPIIPCKPHVRLTYEPVRSLGEACDRFTELVTKNEPPEFVEGLMFSRERGVILHGDFADLPPSVKENAIGRWYKPWFYKHAERVLRLGARTEYLPLRQWYHRHTRSLYWHGELLVPFGNSPFFRYPLGWLMPPKIAVLKRFQSDAIRRFREERNVAQDGLLPLRHLREAIEMFHREFETYPLWLCPHRVDRRHPAGMLSPSPTAEDWEMYVDVGAWQVPGFVKRGEAWDARRAVRSMERWLREHHGYQCLYAVTEQSREEFWQMFDPALYRQIRRTYGADGAFLDVYDRVKRT